LGLARARWPWSCASAVAANATPVNAKPIACPRRILSSPVWIVEAPKS